MKPLRLPNITLSCRLVSVAVLTNTLTHAYHVFQPRFASQDAIMKKRQAAIEEAYAAQVRYTDPSTIPFHGRDRVRPTDSVVNAHVNGFAPAPSVGRRQRVAPSGL